MGEIARLPHPLFAGFWLTRYIAILACLMFGLVPWPLFIAVASFGPAEAWGIVWKTEFRDQLSEIWTWLLRYLAKDPESPWGWNLLAPCGAAIEAAAVHRLLRWGGTDPVWALIMTGTLWGVLWLHWWRPDKWG